VISRARTWIFIALATGLGSGCRWEYDLLDGVSGGAGSSAHAGASGSGTGGIAAAGGGGALTGGVHAGGGTAGTSAGSGGLVDAGGLAGGGAGGTAIGGMDFGGAPAGGGAGTGGAETGGVETAGAGGGGVATGGMATGGVETGGVAAGGIATGGVDIAAGGMVTGGTGTGGVTTGGVAAGGAPTGGVATGGIANGGVATGGVPTGGVATGGVATGGVPTGGGAATGGAGGSSGVCVPDESCTCGTYGGHDYRFCPVELWYSQALADCQSVGMTLVKVDDAAENAWLTTEAQARGLLTGRTPAVFLGGDDIAVDGEWRWVVDNTLFWNGAAVPGVYSDWTSPPGRGGQANCLIMGSDGRWTARACNSGAVTYMCESP
jgi:hypothetical protein